MSDLCSWIHGRSTKGRQTGLIRWVSRERTSFHQLHAVTPLTFVQLIGRAAHPGVSTEKMARAPPSYAHGFRLGLVHLDFNHAYSVAVWCLIEFKVKLRGLWLPRRRWRQVTMVASQLRRRDEDENTRYDQSDPEYEEDDPEGVDCFAFLVVEATVGRREDNK